MLLSIEMGKLRPERGDWQQPLSSPSPLAGLAPGRDIYKADKGAERIFQTPKLRNLSSPSMDIVFNYRFGMVGGALRGGAGGGHHCLVIPKGLTLLSLPTESPQGQAPACATASPHGTPFLRDPDGFVASLPILCRGPQVCVWVLGG